ncbi:MAG TPA: tRNA pseudouridine(38-40) synthase TruA [Pyrinomonadaceae bacterium]
MNFKLLLQYDGTDFHGWQMQDGLRTVQGEMTRVLSLLDDREVVVHGSGRTDAGVHAEGQVASVNLTREILPGKLRSAINGNLPRDVRVLFADRVADDFHARYSAVSKTYAYRVVHGQTMSPFWTRYASQEARSLNLEYMRQCARLFLGEHDWSAFSAAQADTESRVRKVLRCDVDDRWNAMGRCHLIEIRVGANGFLRYMVRSIVGTLLAAGRAEIDADSIAQAIQSGQRDVAGPTAPAHGLTLKSVHYD